MSGARRSLLVLVLPALLALAWPQASTPQTRDPKAGLQEVQRDIEEQRAAKESAHREADALNAEVTEVRERLVAVARTVRELEGEALTLERRIAEVETVEGERVQRLAGERDRAAIVVSAMVRLARFPPEAVIAQPVPPADVVRAAIAVRAAVPLVERAAGTLRGEVAGLGATRADLKERRKVLAQKLSRLEKDRKDLDSLLGKRRELLRVAATREKKADVRVEELSQRAKDLQDLIERIERDRREQAAREADARARAEAAALRKAQESAARKAEEDARRQQAAARSVERSKGRLLFPVAGRVVGLYGQPTGAGLARKGVEIEARSEAQVVAPFEGEVVFAGPFRGYGRILIIDHGEGYHSLLAGLERIEGTPGQRIMAGEPIGRMGRLGAGPPVLYLEFRRDGQPINPLPWLARGGDGVNG